MYEKTDWKARQGSNLNKFTKSNETSTSVVLENTPDVITVPGTPFNDVNMNKIEQGIYNAHEMIAAEMKNRQAADEYLQQQIIALTPEGQEDILTELKEVRNILENIGDIEQIDIANNEGELGLVTGAEDLGDGSNDGMITVQPDGKMRVIGYERLGQGSDIEVSNVFNLACTPFLTASAKRKLTIKGGTRIQLGEDIFFPHEDIELNIPDILDTGSPANGKDYYLHLIHGGDGLDIIASLNKTVPNGLNPGDSKVPGGFHTLCANVGSNLTYVEGGVTKDHLLKGYVASDILPYSVWCLNHRPFSESEGMAYIPSLDFWVDIYLQSGSGANTKSVYQGAITRNRQYVDFVEDLFCVKKTLLNDEEFAAAMLGSNEQTAVAGASEAGATTNGAGGRSDTAGRRMISIYGIEEGCGSLWQWLRTTSAAGYSGYMDPIGSVATSSYGPYAQSGGKGSFWGLAGALLAGGSWINGAGCGSRSRYAAGSRSHASASLGGRGRSRPLRILAY